MGALVRIQMRFYLSLSRTFVSKQGEYNKKSSQDLSSYFEAKSGKKSARYL